MSTALVFPGQGSQTVGMGRDLAEQFPVARAVFEEVDAALSQKLSEIMWSGPESALTMTANTQPALMAHSMAAFRVLQAEAGLSLEQVSCLAGHSLGEYSALCAAGAMDLATTARLLRIRGDAMQAAVPAGQGGMAAVLGLSIEEVEQALTSLNDCQVANDNCPGQVVISGTAQAIEVASLSLKEAGAKRVVPLAVSAPFHSSLMAPAAEKMATALADAKIGEPQVPVVANVTAQPVKAPDDIRKLLVEQVTGRVRWVDSVRFMRENGTSRFVETGSGKVLSGLIKKIDREATTLSVSSPDDVSAFTSP
ncbi:ACP S-malonyltransferase [Parvularcula sp. IMCC14364]|uniref:ACP S-malonyltransferase n=1 Tax=Parvularcula sp. IMCC14364 TaxID=3067902 RepID=UPI0027421313|nr:ACP S-malonyltransferase [Parvularcula sp. IMCC14364]